MCAHLVVVLVCLSIGFVCVRVLLVMAQDHLTLENNISPNPSAKPTMTVMKGPASQASIIEKGPLRIVITDSPSDSTMDHHIRELVKLNVKHICRACEPGYSTDALKAAKIEVHDFAFQDGDPPSQVIINGWLELIDKLFLKKGPGQLGPTERISVHCVAGLGRAPVLVAVALIEGCRLEPLEAVQFIRKHRRGAINKKQLTWLEHYQPRHRNLQCGCGPGKLFSILFGGRPTAVGKA